MVVMKYQESCLFVMVPDVIDDGVSCSSFLKLLFLDSHIVFVVVLLALAAPPRSGGKIPLLQEQLLFPSNGTAPALPPDSCTESVTEIDRDLFTAIALVV